MAHFSAKRFEGTYNQVPRIEWHQLVDSDFSILKWAEMYPINAKGQPVGLLTPRLACKLFHDGIFTINKADENPKYYQDRLPECVHKFFKKKQFRKQCVESGRRVVCRLAEGLGFAPNCVADEIFVYILLKDAFDLGWRRIQAYIENLPENEKDRDYSRVQRLTGAEEISFLYRAGADDKVVAAPTAKPSKEAKEQAKARESKTAYSDFRNWFHAYDAHKMHDHEVIVHEVLEHHEHANPSAIEA